MIDKKDVSAIAEIQDLVSYGYDKATIKKRVKSFSDELFSIAKARIKNRREQKISGDFIFNEDDLRFCTNSEIARYRAERLRCGTIIDIGCGIGVQAIGFARTCKKVIAIELDKRKIEYAKANAEIEGIKNIEFINGDAVNALEGIKSADVIFWDPARLPFEKERSLKTIRPDFNTVIKKAVVITGDIAVEIPPQIDRDKIKGDFGLEYISIDNKLNRLMLCLGKLKVSHISVVSLPSGERLDSKYDFVEEPETSSELKDYIYEVDTSVIKAGLTGLLVKNVKGIELVSMQGKVYATSEEEIKSSFLRPYRIIGTSSKKELRYFLNKNRIGKTIIHGSVDDKEYSKLRSSIQCGLDGDRTAHLFLDKDGVVVALKI